MPTTGAALSAADRAAFGAWLEARRVRAGRSKNHVLRKAGIPIERFNSYVEGGVIPGAATLARIAEALDIPWPIAFWRAGYLREVLAGIDRIAETLAAKRGKMGLAARAALVDFALRAFPRRDADTSIPMRADSSDAQDAAVRCLDVLSFDEVFARGEPLRLHPMLARAADALLDDVAPIEIRRFVAGEYVNAWADAYNYGLACAARAGELHDPGVPTAIMARLVLDDQPKGA